VSSYLARVREIYVYHLQLDARWKALPNSVQIHIPLVSQKDLTLLIMYPQSI